MSSIHFNFEIPYHSRNEAYLARKAAEDADQENIFTDNDPLLKANNNQNSVVIHLPSEPKGTQSRLNNQTTIHFSEKERIVLHPSKGSEPKAKSVDHPSAQDKPHWIWYLVPAMVLLSMGGFLLQSHLDTGHISLNTISSIGSIAILTSAVVLGIILWRSEVSKNKKWNLIGKCLGTFVLLMGLYFSGHYLQNMAIPGFTAFKAMPIELSLCTAAVVGSIASVLLINRLRS